MVLPKTTINIQISKIGLSLICKTYQNIRKEFAFIYFESLKFLIIDSPTSRQL